MSPLENLLENYKLLSFIHIFVEIGTFEWINSSFLMQLNLPLGLPLFVKHRIPNFRPTRGGGGGSFRDALFAMWSHECSDATGSFCSGFTRHGALEFSFGCAPKGPSQTKCYTINKNKLKLCS